MAVAALVNGNDIVFLIARGRDKEFPKLLESFTADQPQTGLQTEYSYSGLGIGVAAGGAVVAGVGVYLWVRASHAKPRSSAPMVSLSRDGGSVGWATTF